jgi:hypothetical protein
LGFKNGTAFLKNWIHKIYLAELIPGWSILHQSNDQRLVVLNDFKNLIKKKMVNKVKKSKFKRIQL